MTKRNPPVAKFKLYVDGEYLGTYEGESAEQLQREFREDHDAHDPAIIVEAIPVELARPADWFF
jgi:hypothetical protein